MTTEEEEIAITVYVNQGCVAHISMTTDTRARTKWSNERFNAAPT